ncbi:MAG: hypothetical protein ACFB51_18625 [Anaerolineae bacterium]
MPGGLLALQSGVYGLALWLGIYLIMRDITKPRLHLAGWGMVTYALALGADLLAAVSSGGAVARLHNLLVIIPPLLWTGAVIRLLPESVPVRRLAWRGWLIGLLPTALILLCAAAVSDLPIGLGDGGSPLTLALSVLVVLPLLGCFFLIVAYRRVVAPRRMVPLLLVGLLFVALGSGLLLSPLTRLPRPLILFGIGFDVMLLGVATAVHDAFDEGETLLPDLLHSFDAALLTAGLLGGQVGVVMFLATGITLPMTALLLGVTGSAVVLVTLGGPLQALVDRLAFMASPSTAQQRDELRAAAQAAPRVAHTFNPVGTDPAAFNKLTRRALSYMGDLSRLAKSPLTQLPLIDQRLDDRGIEPDTLARAHELKRLLTESIERLKPHGPEMFGTSDEWRYFNALYWIYVRGLRPYSRRFTVNGDMPDDEQQALDWFRAQVPERTLYNWQNTAAELIAQDLREQMAVNGSVAPSDGSGRRDTMKPK